MRFVPVVVGAGMVLATPGPATAQVMYSVRDLGNPYAAGFTLGHSINASGQVAGDAYPTGSLLNTHAFRVAPGGQVADSGADLGTLGGTRSTANAINSSGQVTGYSISATSVSGHAYRTSATGDITTATELSPPSGRTSIGFAINDVGQVAGFAYMFSGPNDTNHAFRTTPTGTIDVTADLGTLGGSNSEAHGINASGQVTGVSDMPGNMSEHAFRTSATGTLSTAEDLGTFGGAQSTGFAIDASGRVVGRASFPGDLVTHAFRSSPNGQPLVLEDLGALNGTNSVAIGINSLGVVVGAIDLATFGGRAFVFDTQMRDLSTLVPAGWTIESASGINDFGQIVGWGHFQSGGTHAVVLTPVPEPSSFALAGLAALSAVRRTRVARGRLPADSAAP